MTKIWFCASLPLVLVLLTVPAFGDDDFAGEWAPLFHEDNPERLPGPELGDYMGIPINDAARLRGDSYDADRISVVTEYQCRPHGGDYSMRGLSNMRIDSIIDPVTQTSHRDSHADELSGDGTDHLAGRTAASVRHGAAHISRLFDGYLGWQHAERLHDASEGKLPATQWPSPQQQSDVSRALGQAWKLSHGYHRDHGPGLS